MMAEVSAQRRVDLSNCEAEPIHIPGAIQPHGLLLVCNDADLVITQVATNVSAHLGKTPQAVLGRKVTELFDVASARNLTSAARELSLRTVSPLRVETADGRAFEVVLHRPLNGAGLLVVELEPTSRTSGGGPGFDPRLRAAILRLQSATDESSLTRIAAEEVRSLTGFDRVMIYRFDAQWNGSVIAEAKIDGIDSFFGQHYPASDIPAQARRLYELNWLRLIADARYTPAPMVALEAGPPLDMSHAVLRSVSPIHLEYLANMGVRASMSISLMRNGQLAGLIACHHYSGPRLVPFAIRETCEYLGQALSWQGNVLRGAAIANQQRHVQEHEAEIIRAVAEKAELLDGLGAPALTTFANASGAAIILVEGIRRVGSAPGDEQLAVIVEYLSSHQKDVFETDKLADHIPAAADWTDIASGLLAVAISREVGEYLLWFRPSTERVINWGGNPDHTKLTTSAGHPDRLSPRGSFAVWSETVRGRSLPWQPWEVEGASSLRRLLLGGVRRRAAELRGMNERLIQADRAKDNFIATVSHELRTPLNAISGWAKLLREGGVSRDKTDYALEVISRNVETQSQLVEDLLDVSRMTSGKLTLDVEAVDLPAVIEGAIQTASLAAEARSIRLTSVLDPRASPVLGDAVRLRQVISNLLNNALKFTPKGGSIRVALQRHSSDVELSVKDSGQGISAAFLPHIFDAFRQEDPGMNRRSQGLGLGLSIVRKIVELHGGTASVQSEGTGHGSVFYVRLPLAPLQRQQVPEPPPDSDRPAESLKGVRVLIVEDEPDSRELLRHVLERAGAAVQSAHDSKSALELLDGAAFDVIVADIGLPVVDGLGFMRLVRQRPAESGGRTPSVALTAYTRGIDRTRSLQAGFNAHVPKPVDANELVAVLAAVLHRP
jgi:light-regulated signal transduction histidine kinase (bacteriophytochrome)/ActR/RegA family two-component response regulator